MENPIWLSRTELLLGTEKLQKLRQAHVLVVGLGGVGSAAAEMIVRGGVGKISIADGDQIEASNRNRQLVALCSTDKADKAKVMGERLLDINPDLELGVIQEYLKTAEMEALLQQKFDYVVDCIDTLTPKVHLIYNAVKQNTPIISAMGAGGKIHPEKIQLADISETYNCRLARYVRKRLHRFGIRNGVKTVFSPEEIEASRVILNQEGATKKSTIGTISYMPPLFGAYCASVVLRDLI